MPGATASFRARRLPRVLAALGVGLLLVPLAAGCGGPRQAGPTAAAHQVAAAQRAELAGGSGVTWGVDALPATLNVHHRDATEVTAQVAGAVLPMLFTLDAQGTPRMNTDYLRAAEVTAREPRQKVVYTLHPRARWSDGTPLGAADLRAQWRALSGDDPAYWAASAAGYDQVAAVTAGPGKRQVTVTFARPFAEWRGLFTPLYPQAVTGDPERFNDFASASGPASDGTSDGASRAPQPPPAAGPFRVARLDRAAGTLTLARNDDWWGDRALLTELVFAAVPRREREAALLAGDLDVAEIAPAEADRITAARQAPAPGAPGDPEGGAADAAGAALHAWASAEATGQHGPEAAGARERYTQALEADQRLRDREFAAREDTVRERLARYRVYRAYAPRYTHLALNGSAGPLADEHVRWALARALDRQKLAETVHVPAGLPVQPLGNHLLTLGQAGYQDNAAALGEPGTDAATALLEEAGWRLPAADAAADGDGKAAQPGPPAGQAPASEAQTAPLHQAGAGVRVKEDEALHLRFLLPSGPGTEQLRATGRRVAEMLAAGGVSTEITHVPAEEFLTERVPSGDFDLALYSWPATAYPATQAAPLFRKPQPFSGGLLAGQNHTRVGSDHLDQLLRQAAGELDGEERGALLNEADARIWALAASLPLYQPPQLVAARADLAGVGAHGLATPRYQDIGYRR